MNQKKESIIKGNITNFIDTLIQLNNAYYTRNKNKAEIDIYKLPCILERYATRLFTQYEDWTTINDDIKYMDMIKKSICNRIEDVTLHENLKQFIQEQQDINGMMYYTFTILSHAKVI